MSAAITLKGMTWSHSRGHDPLFACASIWKERTGVSIAWDKRSLQDFESFPVDDLAQRYDLVVIDHPHVGQVADEGCLLALNGPERETEATALQAASVGASYRSYHWRDRQWALPIDAAAEVQAWRPDRIDAPAVTWDEVVALAGEGRVLCPLMEPHSLMVFFTLAANVGRPCAVTGPGDLIDVATGRDVLAMMGALTEAMDPGAFAMDPIAVFERMAKAESEIACVPFIYGYVNYAIAGFREARLAFADIPVAGGHGPVGSALGGTGIAVSSRTEHPREAADFAYWLASGTVQAGPYARAGGQPAHAQAWEDEAVNQPTGDFYRNTRRTLEGAWLRPRHNGYMAFQHAAAERINRGLQGGDRPEQVIEDLNRAFRDSFAQL